MTNSSISALKSSSLAALLVLLVGCATVPAVSTFDAATWVSQNRALVVKLEADKLLATGQLAQELPNWAELLKRTKTLWLGLPDPQGQGWPSTLVKARVVLEGDFPSLAVGWALFWNRPPQPWVVSQPREGMLAVQALPLPWGASPPRNGPVSASAGAVSVTLKQPSSVLLGPAAARLLPVGQLALNLEAGPVLLQGRLSLEMPDTRTASAGLILLKLAGSLLDEKLNQRLVWRAEDRLLIGDNFVVTQADLLPWVRRTFAQLQEASP